MKQNPVHFAPRVLLITIFVLISALNIVFGQTKSEKINELMTLFYEYGQFNGAVLVAEQGKVIYKKGFGFANMEWDIPNQADTKFRLASITKQFTSMMILQLVQQGKLKLDGKITEYIPDYPKKTGDNITIHHLLTHSSGIPDYTVFQNYRSNISRNTSTPEAFVKLFADSALLFEPGTRFSYSNSGYFLLGVIIEKITGKPYEQVLQENILSPCNMNSTGYDHPRTILKKRASGYERNGVTYVNTPYLDMSVPYSAGALYSTVEDMYLWDQALNTDKLLSEKMRDLLFTPYFPASGFSYGYGWNVGNAPVGRTSDSVMVIQHGGGINGFVTLISRIPSDKSLVVLLNNTGSARLDNISRAIRGILYDKPYDLPKKSIADTVWTTITEKGLTSGLELFNELKHSEIYEVREGEMNMMGYRLLGLNKVKDAIEVLKLNVDAFPKSSNAYDSLGEAYMISGDKELAIQNYKKSVELNPNNTNGIETLKKLQAK